MKRILFAAPVIALVACGGGDSTCKVGDSTTCDSGKVCEPVQGQDKPACFAPVVVQGRVFDLATDAGIANAQVTAEEVSGRSVGQVATTAADGTYSLNIPSTRSDTKGTPVGQTLKLSAAAHDYVPFPSGFRVALPVDTTGATAGGSAQYVVTAGPTTIGLDKLSADRLGLPNISGNVQVTTADGGTSDSEILVAAEQQGGSGTPATFTARADSSGKYTVFNVPAGTYAVQAYRRGSNYTAAQASVASVDVPNVNIAVSQVPTATLTGTADIVAGSGATSIVLALADTFNSNLRRGTLVPGLRSPDPGVAPNVSGGFSIAGVPDGKYVVLAGFENDGLVQDPDPNIAGTLIQTVNVSNGTADIQPAFKVTGAISLTSPGGGDTVDDVSGTPTFTWVPYPSAQSYKIQVFDTFGTEVWNNTFSATTGATQSLAYGGPALSAGTLYQWRLTAFGNNGNPISTTEDLKGIFREAP